MYTKTIYFRTRPSTKELLTTMFKLDRESPDTYVSIVCTETFETIAERCNGKWQTNKPIKL